MNPKFVLRRGAEYLVMVDCRPTWVEYDKKYAFFVTSYWKAVEMALEHRAAVWMRFPEDGFEKMVGPDFTHP